MKIVIDIPEMAYEAYKEWNKNMVATVEQSLIANGTPYEDRPQEASDCIPVKDLINFIRNCREELFEKMKDYHQREFEIRYDMLTNFEQLVRLASSKYKADMRGEENDK